ncbi:MAG: hypothetical protein ACREDH_05405 [Methylocella sp.]
MNDKLTWRDVDAALASDDAVRTALLALSLHNSTLASLQHAMRTAFLAGAKWAVLELHFESTMLHVVSRARAQ